MSQLARKNLRHVLLALVIFATWLGVTSSFAAVISWSAANISSSTDVDTSGTLVLGQIIGSTTAQTINGVTFSGEANTTSYTTRTYGSGTTVQFTFPSGNGSGSSFVSSSLGGSATTYNSALATRRYYDSAGTVTITLAGLTSGKIYRVQFWGAYGTGADANKTLTYNDGNGNTVTCKQKGNVNEAQYCTGTFVASGTTQTITVTNGSSTLPAFDFNMFQLRDLGPNASVTWTANAISSSTDVDTNGTLVLGQMMATNTAQTVNGVTFSAETSTAGYTTRTYGSGTTVQVTFPGNANTVSSIVSSSLGGSGTAYNAALLFRRYYDTNGTVVITLGGLTSGRIYRMQFWGVYGSASDVNKTLTYNDGKGNTVICKQKGAVGEAQYCTGTFVASGTTQTITVTNGSSLSPAFDFSMFQLRDLGPNAPVTWTAGAINSPTDIDTNGTMKVAQLFGTNAGPLTINGVDFSGEPDNNSWTNRTFGSGTTVQFTLPGNANAGASFVSTNLGGLGTIYNTGLSSRRYQDAAGTAIITLSGLTSGNTYRIQSWGAFGTGADANKTLTYSDGNGNTVTCKQKGDVGEAQYCIGTFVASGSIQIISVANGSSITPAFDFNMFQLRDLGAPAAAPIISSLPTASPISYGQTLASSTLSGGAATNAAGSSVPGSFAFTITSLVPNAGSTNVSVTFTPTDSVNYSSVTTNVTVSVSQTTPTLTAPNAGPILLGKTLAASALTGGAAINSFNGNTVAGTFAFTTPSLLPTSTTNVSVTFTPADTANYNGVTTTVTVVVITRTNWIEVYGSSVAQGWNGGGSLTNGSYANGYAGLLTAALGAGGWFVTNNATPGDNTALGLARFPTHVASVAPNYIMLAFGLNNEGLEFTSDPAGTVATFLNNLTNLISQCRSNGYYPVVNSAYPSTNYTASKYAYLKAANLTINSWNVPSVNLLGALDDGNGRYVAGYNSDAIHPNTAGHQEMFYAIVPTLFDAIAQGRTNSPALATTNYARLTQSAGVTTPLVFTPSNTIHSFTMSFRVRSTDNGAIAAIGTGSGHATLQITNGQFVYSGTNGNQIVAAGINATNGDWHDIAFANRFAITNSWLFVDGVAVGTNVEQFVPDQFILGGPGASGAPATPATVDFQNWCVYRSAWNLDEAQAQMNGNLQQASMEIGAMLDDASFTSNSPAANRAQSLSVAIVNTANFTAMQSVAPPSNLSAQALSGISVKLAWTPNSASSLVLERRVTGATAWIDVAVLPAGTTAYTNSGLTAGVTYDYRVAAVEGGLRGNYSNVATVVPGLGIHQTILIDFGPNDVTNGVVTTSPDYLGQYWNNFVGAGGGAALPVIGLANLVTTTNGLTSIGMFSSASGWAANGILNGGLLTPSYALLGNFAVTNATEDYFLTTTVDNSAKITITNLDPTLNYRLRLFGTRNTTETRVTRYMVTGGNGSFTKDLTNSGTGIGAGGYNGNNNTIASINGVTTYGSSNQIQLSVSLLTGSFAHLGIMEIAANNSPVAQALSTNITFGQTITVDVINGANTPTDADGDAVTVSAVSGALTGSGTITTNGGTGFNFTATAAGTTTFSYTVTDLYGGSGTNLVTVSVVKADSSASVTGSSSFTYNAAGQGPASATVNGSSGAVTYSYSGSGYGPSANAPTNAGSYTATANVAADSNYNGATSTAFSFTINPAFLGITANSSSKAYGQSVTFAGTEFSVDGLVGSDSVSSVTLTSTGATNTAAVGSYSIVPSAAVGTGLGNYSITYTNGTLTVNPAVHPIAQDITVAGGAAVVSFTGTPDVTYVTQSAPDLNGPWINISTNTPAGTTWSVTNSITGDNLKFYRTVIP